MENPYLNAVKPSGNVVANLLDLDDDIGATGGGGTGGYTIGYTGVNLSQPPQPNLISRESHLTGITQQNQALAGLTSGLSTINFSSPSSLGGDLFNLQSGYISVPSLFLGAQNGKGLEITGTCKSYLLPH